eukprot:s1598_g4.t3
MGCCPNLASIFSCRCPCVPWFEPTKSRAPVVNTGHSQGEKGHDDFLTFLSEDIWRNDFWHGSCEAPVMNCQDSMDEVCHVLAVLGQDQVGYGQGLQSTECGNGRSKTLLPFVSLVFSTIDCVIRAALKLTKAPLLSFGWLGTGSRVASGEDGWETVLGSIVLGQGISGGRQRWLLEILSLDGLLCIGLADERLQSNALLGTRSNGRWHAWGWELGPRGSVEAVSSSAAPETGRPAACHLVPQGQRVILVLHLLRMGSRMRLELAAMILSSSWHWHFLGAHSFMTPTHYQDAVNDGVNFRPAVSTDIGATVRVLASDAFSSTAWITSCSLRDAD